MNRGAAGAILLLLAAGAPRLTWEDRHPLPQGAGGGAAGLVGGSLVYAGGTNWTGGQKRWLREVYEYNIAADRWLAGPPLPAPMAYGAWSYSAEALEIYGGTDGSRAFRDCWRLEAGQHAWVPAGQAPADTLLARAERIGQQVYLFGGCSDVADLTRCGDAVHLRERVGVWRRISALPQGALAMAASAVANGRVYLFGGCSMSSPGRLVNRDDAWSFDPRTGQWRRLRPLPHANRGLSAAAVSDRYVLLFGGYTASAREAAGKPADFGFSSTVLAYDIERDVYTELAPMPMAVSEMPMIPAGNVIFGIGGEHRMRGRTPRLLAARLHK